MTNTLEPAVPVTSQTRSFTTIFLIEMWERFGFYGMQALIVYYMVQRLGFADDRANLVWSAATALIYVAPAIGGWVGDRILGTRRTMLLGAIILGLGYALMGLPTDNVWALFGALSVITVGNGLFKPNSGNLVRKIYEGDDSKIDSAFTIYYMAVNIGSTFSMLLTPWIKDYINRTYGNEFGWHAAFLVCSFGLVIGLANYSLMRKSMRHIGSEPDQRPLNIGHLLLVLLAGAVLAIGSAVVLNYETLAEIFVYGAGIVLLGIFAHLIRSSDRSERSGLIAALVLVVQTIFFFIFYQQMSTSLALFALRNVDWNQSLFGLHLFTWNPAQYQALNPLWIFALSPPLAWIYTTAGKRGKDFSIAAKFVLGFLMVAVGFFLFGAAGHYAGGDGKTSSWVMIWGYGFYSLGELLVSGLGLAMIARYVPARMGGFMMGAYFVAVGISSYLGGVVANFASVPRDLTNPLKTLPVYTALFNKLGWAALVCTLIALAVLPLMRRLSATHNSHAPQNGTSAH
ncbi:MAG: peptide MFS transporter [Metallibacterium scheffleri]|jgi:POT family proton-dependent oligopeptide transporter|uniref:peptide MFS transporter n=1 Tax=Metallibacterium scheffleri TaxID=993689 RepID=UPI0026F223DF|nr:peptide MFS transporter [Metallibacterium scheffleri]MCK9365984.1 peptide MFS transporter [Metallibacterium scheffleri]